jgi:hypothetical protein
MFHLALRDRLGPVVRTEHNHYSVHAPSCVLLLGAAFEAWLNDLVWSSNLHLADTTELELAGRGVPHKYAKLKEPLEAAPTPPPELQLFVDVRDEIAHPLMRAQPGEGQVPPWLIELHRQHILLSTGSGPDYIPTDKLCSFRLALWSWQTIERLANDLVLALVLTDRDKLHVARTLVGGFSGYRQLWR